MTFAELKNELINLADDSSITGVSQSQWINDAYREVYQAADNWVWAVSSDTDDTVASQAAYTLPTDYVKMFEVRVDDDDYGFVPYIRRNETTWSSMYSIFNGSLYLYPTPGAAGTDNIEMLYYAELSDLTATSDEPIFPKKFHKVLTYGALVNYFEKEGDFNEASYYGQKFQNMVTLMKEFNQKESGFDILRLRDVRETANVATDNTSALST